MKTSQRGFSVVEILVAIVIVGLIGGVGWYIWQSTNKKGSEQPTAQTTEEIKKEESAVKQGYTLYTDSNLSLQYPDAWTPYKEADQPEWIFFKSPDFIPATELGPSVKAGYQLEIRVAQAQGTTTFEEDLSQTKKAKESGGCGGDYEVIKIDGNQAIKSDIKCHGTEISARLYQNGKEYFFRLNSLDEDKPETRDLFTTILETVSIK